jgi:asparagine synthase (glutamine-hydrolysing)
VCGINGLIVVGHVVLGGDVPRAEIAAMNLALAHRGPDGSGEYLEPGVALGHRRLSIPDLSDADHQPMFNEDGSLVLVLNGTIYNYLELVPELQAVGHVFRSRSDSEVILHAYEQWGEACVQRFNGIWAFALWDARRKRLFLSRDRFGVRPLCYLQRGGRFVFSSEAAGILAVEPVREAQLGKLYSYLAYGYRTNDGHTTFAGIDELPPGHNAVLEGGRLVVSRYWALPEHCAPPPAAERVEAYAELLRDAVRVRFRSDVPVALLQSGGLDSSVICTVVNDEIEAGRLGVDSVTAFTAVHPGHSVDESAPVRALMATCPHVRSVEVQPEADRLVERLPEFVRCMQEPVAGATSYSHWCLMQAIRTQGIKVVINGQGADEALAGYGYYIVGYRMLDLLLSNPLAALREARAMLGLMGLGLPHLMAQTAKAALGRHAASEWRARHSEGGARVLSATFARERGYDNPEVRATLTPHNLERHLRSQLLHYSFNQILHDEDQSSMSQAIEIRSPFIDYRLMELGFSLPIEDRFSGGVTKKILRQAFGKRLPPMITDNHRKLGFATPFAAWSTSPTFACFVREVVESPEFRSRRIWNAAELGRRLLDPQAVQSGFPVWRFLNGELWFREFGITNV